MRLNRRDFLHTSGALALTAAATKTGPRGANLVRGLPALVR